MSAVSAAEDPTPVSVRCGKPVEECTECSWRGGNYPDRPCVKCGGQVIQRPCKMWRVPGTTACVKHGSGHKSHRTAGRQRLARGQAAKTLRDVEVVPIGDPLDELANMAARIVAMEQHAADVAAEKAAAGDETAAAAMAEVHRQLVNDAGKLLERCARLGIEGRRTDAMVAQATQIAHVVRGAVEAVFSALLAAAAESGGELTASRIIDVQSAEAAPIMRQALAAARGEEEPA